MPIEAGRQCHQMPYGDVLSSITKRQTAGVSPLGDPLSGLVVDTTYFSVSNGQSH